MTTLGYLIIFALMVFWIMRQNKKDKLKAEQLKESFRPGMYVMLKDGFFGTIVDVNDRDAVINISTEGLDEGCITVSKENIYKVVESSEGTEKKLQKAEQKAPENLLPEDTAAALEEKERPEQ